MQAQHGSQHGSQYRHHWEFVKYCCKALPHWRCLLCGQELSHLKPSSKSKPCLKTEAQV